MGTFLVTGGCGFIGSHLSDALVAAGHRVLAVTAVEGEADLPFVALRDLFEAVSPDTALALPATQRAALDIAKFLMSL